MLKLKDIKRESKPHEKIKHGRAQQAHSGGI
jgi:hypothetical protein